jgi:hypothetical protein
MEPKPVEAMITQAEVGRENSRKWGNRQNRYNGVLTAGAVIAGLLAGISGTANWQHYFTGACGFLAAAFAGLQAAMKPRELAVFHYVNRADFGEAVNLGRILRDRGAPASEAELAELATRIAAIEGRRFQKSGSD